MSKKPNPVPDPIVPEGYEYKIANYHTGNTEQSLLDFISRVKGCRYVTMAWLFEKDTGDEVAVGMCFCSPKDNPNKKTGRITALHRAVRKIHPSFYKEIRLANKK